VPSGKLIEWQYLNDHYIETGTPIEDPILDDPEFRLIFHPSPRQLGVRLRIAEGRELPKISELRHISMRRVQIASESYVLVMTESIPLFPSIYALISDVLRRIEAGETDGLAALADSLRNFEVLLARASGISRDEAIGLYGELLVLESLLLAGKADAKAWIGANRQSHDIRLGTTELEVKTTTSNSRHHFVHGLNQLTPTPGHDLYVVSVRLNSPGSGAGRSLDGLVEDILASLSGDAEGKQYLERELAKTPYERGRKEGSVAYQMAADPMKISIGTDFPVVSHARLEEILGGVAAGRVMRLDFLLNLEGLGAKFVAEAL
jgi:hypothetical protein